MRIRAEGRTDVGRKRERNEDAFLVDDQIGFFAVADGMGGHAAGEVAAQKALFTARSYIWTKSSVLEEVRAGNAEPIRLVKLAEEAVLEACKAVFKLANEKPALAGMGCTFTLLLIANRSAALAHVGDTRAYLYREGDIDQLSTDHTLENELRLRGMATAAKQYPNVITRSIGQQEYVQVDTLALLLEPDDTLLICSDGLHNYVHGPAELAPFLAEADLPRIPRTLVDMANTRGGGDNITALVLRVEVTDAEQEEARALSGSARQRVKALRAVELFHGLPYAELVRILEVCSVRRFTAGQPVIKAGTVSDLLFIVTAGEFEMRPAVGDFWLTLRPGDHMGDTMLLVERACRANLTAVKEGELLMLAGDAFKDLATRRPWVGVKLMMRLARALSIELADVGSTYAEGSTAQRSSRLFF